MEVVDAHIFQIDDVQVIRSLMITQIDLYHPTNNQ